MLSSSSSSRLSPHGSWPASVVPDATLYYPARVNSIREMPPYHSARPSVRES